MTRRNGAVIKTIIVAAVLLCGVYFIYIYNNVSGKLKETERVAERYRREQESLRSQLQDLSASKEDMQQRYENEKNEFVNRLNTLNQHHRMLKSQHDDLEADYTRLQSDRDKEKEDNRLQEAQRNQEYMQLKQEKDLEISSLRDQVANVARDKNECEQQVQTISLQLKESQEQLKQQKIQLMQAQQAQPFGQHKVHDTDLVNKDPDVHQNINQNNDFQRQQIRNQGQVENQNEPLGGKVNHFEQRLKNAGKKTNLAPGGLKVNRFGKGSNVDTDLRPKIDNKAIEHQQQQHQVQPPNLNQVEQQGKRDNSRVKWEQDIKKEHQRILDERARREQEFDTMKKQEEGNLEEDDKEPLDEDDKNANYDDDYDEENGKKEDEVNGLPRH